MNQRIDVMPVNDPHNRQAREAAYQQVSWPVNLTPASVGYHSDGHALIVGNEREARRAARALSGRGLASVSLLLTDPIPAVPAAAPANDEGLLAATRSLPHHALTRSERQALRVDGYLGLFTVTLARAEGPVNLAKALANRNHFDQILDLGEVPLLTLELPPPGYVALASPGHDRATLIEAFADLVGEFDKPRYFQIGPQRCAHAANGRLGCTRCLDVCPADAIHSHPGRIDAHIEIDPFRCHGVGSCTSACPTGAIEFRLPDTHRQQDTVLAWLAAYRQAGGETPVVRFHQAEGASSREDTPGHLLDVPLEELGAAGHDQWLTALAGGATEVRIQRHHDMPERLTSFLEEQLAQARALLSALGHAPERIRLVAPGGLETRDAPPSHPPLGDPLLSLHGTDKRERLNQVITRLGEQGQPDGRRHALTAGAAHGGLQVASTACTLCMACVATCPTPALGAGNDSPRLTFREADCVQCGLCAEACPEQAITLIPGFLADAARTARRVCHEEPAFACIRCGKPFASASTIATIKAKLADHPYFAGEALARLEMCEDCRVRDVWRDMARHPESQLKV
ncbi:4Fe-4S binding protein [Halomonas cerina]|uniref:Ferredoxin n=1 Tax=Halomonas cerina TaxID=447424 RepID=A0A839UZZ7_9GAMM|nr:4Fe-4S binding protein [Halomonas cerina]MBB3189093.1 ferredoxin [Halomonas cerina]